MRLSRDDLKALVKECLVELLNEGIGSYASKDPRVVMKRASPFLKAESLPSQKRSIVQQGQQQRPVSQNTALQEAVKVGSGGDPTLAAILADTAQTTLQEQLNAEMMGSAPPGASREAQVVAQVDPVDLFGEEAASKWSDLAFMP